MQTQQCYKAIYYIVTSKSETMGSFYSTYNLVAEYQSITDAQTSEVYEETK